MPKDNFQSEENEARINLEIAHQLLLSTSQENIIDTPAHAIYKSALKLYPKIKPLVSKINSQDPAYCILVDRYCRLCRGLHDYSHIQPRSYEDEQYFIPRLQLYSYVTTIHLNDNLLVYAGLHLPPIEHAGHD